MPLTSIFWEKSSESCSNFEQGTIDYQRAVTGILKIIVEVVKKEQVANPSRIVVGEFVKLLEILLWFPKRKKEAFDL